MTIDFSKTFGHEGDAYVPKEKEPSSESSAEETGAEGENEGGAGAADGDGSPAKPLPFNEDPKVQEYIERQVTTRVEKAKDEIIKASKGDIDTIREEFGKKRDQNAAASKIPAWFGGSQEQWDEYRKWFDGQLTEAEGRAVNKTIEQSRETSNAEQKRVDEATEYLKTELASITVDKKLNPTGKAIDANALLKIVIDNDLVDSKGRWNYRAGMKFLSSHPNASHAPNKDKKLAGATVDGAGGGTGGEPKPKNFKTPADFKKKRPW